MSRFKGIVSSVIALIQMSLFAQTYHTMKAQDNMGASSFNTGTNWTDGLAPVAGEYYLANYQIRTPDNTTKQAYTFAGEELRIRNSLLWKSNGQVTINRLVLDTGSGISHGLDYQTCDILGHIYVEQNSGFSIFDPNPRHFRVFSQLHGSASLACTMSSTNQFSKSIQLYGDNSDFTGKWELRGTELLLIHTDSNLGAVPATLVANALTLNGPALYVTNSVTLAATRGITLATSTANSGLPRGVFYPGTGSTLTVQAPITGGGALHKIGAGTLRLTNTNTYTGATIVKEGLLFMEKGMGASTSLQLAGGSVGFGVPVTLASLALTNSAASTIHLAFELATMNPAQAQITLTGNLTRDALKEIVLSINTNACQNTTYALLTAANLDSYQDYDFLVHQPWLGTLSFSPDHKTLLFTPNRPEQIAFKTATDNLENTGFTNTFWNPPTPPSAGNVYVQTNFMTRLPPGAPSRTFPAPFIMDGSELSLKGAANAMPSIPELTVMNQAFFSMTQPDLSILTGTVRLVNFSDRNKTYALSITSWANTRNLNLYSELRGYGTLRLDCQGNPSYGRTYYTLANNNTNFFGRILCFGNTNYLIRITSPANIGGSLPITTNNWLTFNGSGLSVTNTVTLSDPGRGIYLDPATGYAGTSTDPGSYTNSTPAADRAYEGGATFSVDTNTATLTIASPISGAGSLRKDGKGLLRLAGNNTNYTGTTTIRHGSLELLHSAALGKQGQLTFKSQTQWAFTPDSYAAQPVFKALQFEAGSTLVLSTNLIASAVQSPLPLFSVIESAPVATLPSISLNSRIFTAALQASAPANGLILYSVKLTYIEGTAIMVR